MSVVARPVRVRERVVGSDRRVASEIDSPDLRIKSALDSIHDRRLGPGRRTGRGASRAASHQATRAASSSASRARRKAASWSSNRPRASEQGGLVLAEDARPERGVGAGDPGPVAVGARGQAEHLGGDGRRQGRGDGVRQVAGQGERLVVRRRGRSRRPGSPAPPRSRRARSSRSAGVRGVGVRTQARPSNRSASACAGPLPLGAGDRVAADERRPRPRSSRSTASTIVRLVLPASVTRTPAGPCSAAAQDVLGDQRHGRADDHDVGLGDAPRPGRSCTSSIAPTRTASARLASLRPIPTTRAGQRPRRGAPARSSRRSGRRRRSPPSPVAPRLRPSPSTTDARRPRSPRMPCSDEPMPGPMLGHEAPRRPQCRPGRRRSVSRGSGPRRTPRSVEERPERVGHGGGRLPAVARLLLQRLAEDPLEALGGVGAVGPEGDGGVLQDHAVGVGLVRVEVAGRGIGGSAGNRAWPRRCRCRRAP